MSSRVLGIGLVSFALVLAGCDRGDDPADAGAVSTSSTTAATPTSTTDEDDPAIAVVLGLDRLVVGGNALVYGAPRSQVRAYLDRAFGRPPATEERDCGPGRLVSHRWEGITAYVDATGFVGWAAEGEAFVTESGIGIGSSRSEVEAAYPQATVTESSLGTELFVPGPAEGGGLSGIYEGGEVIALWSGATCVAR